MPKINAIRQNEIKEEFEAGSFKAEQSRSRTLPEVNSVSWCRPPLVKQFYSGSLKMWLPMSLHPNFIDQSRPEVGEIQQDPADPKVDIRPHIFDPVKKEFVLCDSGSQVSAFPPDPGDSPDPNLVLKAANGSKMTCYGFKETSIKIGHKSYPFKIIKAQVESPILGWDFMTKYRLELRWDQNDELIIYDKKNKIGSKMHFKPIPTEKSVQLKNLSLISAESHLDSELDSPEILAGEVAAMQALAEEGALGEDEDISILPEGPYRNLVAKFPKLLKQNFHCEPTDTIIHRIQTNGTPVKAKVRRLLPGSEKAIKAKQAWDELIQLGIVEKVDPEKANTYCSPLHFVPKPNGFLRPVGDFRLLNLQTELDQFPLPHLRDFTHQIAGCRVFSKVDLRKAFHSIVIDKRDRFKTCVTTPWGLFNFKRLAMGMRNSAQSFQRMVQAVIGDMEGIFCYLDDLLIYSKTEDKHKEILEELFKKLEAANLTLALSKCEFGKSSLEYLGYQVSSEGLVPVRKKIEALQQFPPPAKQKDLLAFLGALNYYRASLPRLKPEDSVDKTMPERSPAAVLDPLYKLATCNIKKQKGNYFSDIWNQHEHLRNAFEDAKMLLQKAIVLEFPIPSAPLALSTDASKFCLGASLEQYVDGQWRCLGLWSKSLNPSQQRYSTYIRELLAIKFAIRHFINEINGRSLTIYTDHMPILGSWRNPNLQMHDNVAMNAINEIAQWTSDIQHKPGKNLVVPDLMSRPFKSGNAYQVQPDIPGAPDYVPPEATMAALEQVALNVVSPKTIADEQKSCPDVVKHRNGLKPGSVVMGDIDISGQNLYCEISGKQPRPLLPESQRSLVLNLLHHQDHPSAKETLRRASQDYYWPHMREQVEQFVRTCHPCQVAKQSPTVKAGVSAFPVPDQRFSVVHLDVVGPLPTSNGFKYLLTAFCRTSRWLEAYPMKAATSEECCRAFMEWTSRFGVPHVSVSDNGNTFVSNLYKDIMRTFNIKIQFTPAYHAATNGAIERRHQTIKNSLKASLIDMGNEHGDKWITALPWVLLGKRVQVQPDLDISASQLVFGKAVSLPGQMLGHPGAPLTNVQTRALLEELYKMSAKPPVPTSTVVDPIDVSHTEKAKFVYIKKEDPTGLSSRFEGPYPIVSRPSRSTIEVRIGSFVDGTPRLQVYNWNTCKVAHLREDAQVAQRPMLGRPRTRGSAHTSDLNEVPEPTEASASPSSADPLAAGKQTKRVNAKQQADNHETSSTGCRQQSQPAEGGQIQTDFHETLSGRPPHPDYLAKGPIISREMYDKWTPDLLGPNRPIRSTRNPNPQYVDSVSPA